jgi:hypothetical protein
MEDKDMSITAMKQALEALKEVNTLSVGPFAICLPAEIDTAMDALRQAIEQAEKQEPVAWQWLTTAHFRKKLPKDAEKGAWNPLYTSPPQRQPLDDMTILDLVDKHLYDQETYQALAFARAIEREIKGEA